jgi:hypothetical protein
MAYILTARTDFFRILLGIGDGRTTITRPLAVPERARVYDG